MFKKIMDEYKNFFKLVDAKKGMSSFIIALGLVLVLFLLPYLIILINVFSLFSLVNPVTVILFVFFPIYFQICVGLFFKYFYQLCLSREVGEIEGFKLGKAFIMGFTFLPTFLLITLAVIIFLVLWGILWL